MEVTEKRRGFINYALCYRDHFQILLLMCACTCCPSTSYTRMLQTWSLMIMAWCYKKFWLGSWLVITRSGLPFWGQPLMVYHKSVAGKWCTSDCSQWLFHVSYLHRTFIWAARMDECLPPFPVEKYFEMTPIHSLSVGALEVYAPLRYNISKSLFNKQKFAPGVTPQPRACFVQQAGCFWSNRWLGPSVMRRGLWTSNVSTAN